MSSIFARFKSPNPLNVFGLRKLNHCAPHMTKLVYVMPPIETILKIENWIYCNLEGRYSIERMSTFTHSENKNIPETSLVISFEDSVAATFFAFQYDMIATEENF